jgi:hypothetical protein
MSRIQCSSTLLCNLVLGFSAGMSVGHAEEPLVQRFGVWTVTIQPGLRGSGATVQGLLTGRTHIRLASHAETDSAPNSLVPPAPVGPETSTGVTSASASSEEKPASPSVNPLTLVQKYSQVYNSIPFSRAEYEAYPSYRHDATMEFLFGQMRSTVIQRGTTVMRGGYSAMPYGYSYPYSPYGFNYYYYPFYNMGFYRPYYLW